jgi:hypothetical protein
MAWNPDLRRVRERASDPVGKEISSVELFDKTKDDKNKK